jgi:hypothetical protein
MKANIEELERHGTLAVATATPEGGGPSFTEYWLSFEQAMVIDIYRKDD